MSIKPEELFDFSKYNDPDILADVGCPPSPKDYMDEDVEEYELLDYEHITIESIDHLPLAVAGAKEQHTRGLDIAVSEIYQSLVENPHRTIVGGSIGSHAMFIHYESFNEEEYKSDALNFISCYEEVRRELLEEAKNSSYKDASEDPITAIDIQIKQLQKKKRELTKKKT